MERNRDRLRIGLVFALCMLPCALFAVDLLSPAGRALTIPADFSRPMTVKASVAVVGGTGNLDPLLGILKDAGFDYELYVDESHGPGGVHISSGLLATRTAMFSSAEFNALSSRLGQAAARAGGRVEWTFVQPGASPAPAAMGD